MHSGIIIDNFNNRYNNCRSGNMKEVVLNTSNVEYI